MSLDKLRQKVIFQNTVDVWIAFCSEKNRDWNNPADYVSFVKYLREKNTGMKKYELCISDEESPDEAERAKAKFAKSLSENPDSEGVYAIRLSDSVLETVRNF